MKGRSIQGKAKTSGYVQAAQSFEAPVEWDVKPVLKVGGRTCQCADCERFFTGVQPFEYHLKNTGTDNPICLTDAEMLASGMTQNKYGVWQTGSRNRKPKQGEAA